MNMVGYDTPITDAKNVRKIYLNGVSVEILNQNTDGTIQVQIRFDDTDVNNDVRWCADEIVLNPVSTTSGYSLNLKAGKTITLDQGTTATRMTNPMIFMNMEVFTSPTVFNVQADAKIHMESNARVILKNASTLIMKSASSCVIEDGGIIEVEEGSTMIIEGNSTLSINGKGKLIVRAGATLCISQDAKLTLQKGYENLELEAGVIIPAGCTDPTDDSGISISPNPATSNIVFDYVLQDENNSAELIISDAQGRTIDCITLNGKRGSKMLDTSNYSSGIYFYYTSGNYEKFYGKFIIK
jgi:hypothetical protein